MRSSEENRPPFEITYYNRQKKLIEKELVYGEGFLKWLYQTSSGNFFSNLLVRPFLSRLYGKIQDTSWSQKKIQPFIEQFNIPLSDFLPASGRSMESPYSSFNEFFIREFRPGKRPFARGKDGEEFPAFAEGRYLAYEQISPQQVFPVKGKELSAAQLLQHEQWSKIFEGGPLIIARLCPVDYHRFHFPDDGKVLDFYQIKGKLHSVNPLALRYRSDIFSTNERHVTILETTNFGRLAYIEVGAICVGKIIQSRDLTQGTSFKRGEEKGYFLFGGSTVIVLGEKNKFTIDQDILQKTNERMECFLKVGEKFATRK